MTNEPATGLRPVDETLLEALRADQRRYWMKADEVTSWRPGLRAPKVWLPQLMASLVHRSQGQVVASAQKLIAAGLLTRDPWRLYQLTRDGMPDSWPHPLDEA